MNTKINCWNRVDPLNGILIDVSKIFMTESSNLCENMPVGAFKDVVLYSDESPTTVKHKYRLSRMGDNHYKVTFKLYFKIPPPFKETEMKERMFKKVKSCLSKVNKKSFGPNKEILEFDLYDPSSGNPGLRSNIIEMVPGSIRENSGRWSFETDCPTIFHELLHLAGLVDEYKETDIGKSFDNKTKKYIQVDTDAQKPSYDCRKIYDNDSIMNTQSLRFTESFQTHVLITNFCVSTPEKVKAFYSGPMKNTSLDSCPNGFQLSKVRGNIPLDEEQAKLFSEGKLKMFSAGIHPKDLKEIENSVMIFKVKTFQNNKSLLEPRHFNAIVYPGCYAKNREYYQNSINSYKTSKDHIGSGCSVFPYGITPNSSSR